MKPNLLADESVNYRIVKALRQVGFTVASVSEDCPGSPDPKVLELSVTQEAILLTEDSDFGEWVFAHRANATGVIFLRYSATEEMSVTQALLKILQTHQVSLYHKFVVITKNKVRTREII